jgi:TDG/mug DNA glycosylase family protein
VVTPRGSDRETLAVYEERATEWQDRRAPRPEDQLRGLDDLVDRALERPVADLGCGPGFYTGQLGPGPVALDAAAAMVDLARTAVPDSLPIRADIADLPFARASLGAALASKSYLHLPRSSVPMALADLHRCLVVGAPARFVVLEGDQEHGPVPDDNFAGRNFSMWPPDLFEAVLTGAGLQVDQTERGRRGVGRGMIDVRATRLHSLADTVTPDLRLLISGLNPSPAAADAGVGFARPGNRFWPAALEAGIVTRDRDPIHAARSHGIGMTDLVKRTTRTAGELDPSEYQAGLERLDLMVRWLQPRALCFVGLAGWRAVVDRRATEGVQEQTIGGRPVYLMASTSGLNANHKLPDFVKNLRAAASLADMV